MKLSLKLLTVCNALVRRLFIGGESDGNADGGMAAKEVLRPKAVCGNVFGIFKGPGLNAASAIGTMRKAAGKYPGGRNPAPSRF